MTLKDWLNTTISKLKNADIPTAQLDTEVLLSDHLNKDRSWLHAHPNFDLTDEQITVLDNQIQRRTTHEPLAYIRGKQEFYGRQFYVSPDTLTPRPETETMIEMALAQLSSEHRATSNEGLQIVDVGTGSGCIVITLACELIRRRGDEELQFLGVDVSKEALRIAKKNAKFHNVPVSFKTLDLRTAYSLTRVLASSYTSVVLANLPYVPTGFHINLAASHEPPEAIFGGEDGLDYYRELFKQLYVAREAYTGQRPESSLKNIKRSMLAVYTESLPFQHNALIEIAESHGFELIDSCDFILKFAK